MKSVVDNRSAGDVDRQIGKRIKDRRAEIGETQAGLGEAIGVTFQQVQKYERGVNRVSAARLQQIATVLGVPMRYFLGEEDGHADRDGAPSRGAMTDRAARDLIAVWPRLPDDVKASIAKLAVASAR